MAGARVFGVFELLEKVLVHATTPSTPWVGSRSNRREDVEAVIWLFRTQATSRQAQAVILGSPELQRVLFLRPELPDNRGDRRQNPLLNPDDINQYLVSQQTAYGKPGVEALTGVKTRFTCEGVSRYQDWTTNSVKISWTYTGFKACREWVGCFCKPSTIRVLGPKLQPLTGTMAEMYTDQPPRSIEQTVALPWESHDHAFPGEWRSIGSVHYATLGKLVERLLQETAPLEPSLYGVFREPLRLERKPVQDMTPKRGWLFGDQEIIIGDDED